MIKLFLVILSKRLRENKMSLDIILIACCEFCEKSWVKILIRSSSEIAIKGIVVRSSVCNLSMTSRIP